MRFVSSENTCNNTSLSIYLLYCILSFTLTFPLSPKYSIILEKCSYLHSTSLIHFSFTWTQKYGINNQNINKSRDKYFYVHKYIELHIYSLTFTSHGQIENRQ